MAQTADAKGNKIEVNDRQRDDQQGGGKGRKRERQAGDPFDEVVEEAAGLDDSTPHLIDYTA